MKAAVYSEYGEAEVLSIKTDVAVVPPTASQVVIKVAAVSLFSVSPRPHVHAQPKRSRSSSLPPYASYNIKPHHRLSLLAVSLFSTNTKYFFIFVPRRFPATNVPNI